MNNWIIGRRWNVVQTSPNSEPLAATSAREMGHVVFWPRYKEKRVRRNHKDMEGIFPYLPGYIFTADLRYSHDGRPLSLWELSKAKGVASVIKMGGEFVAVPDTDPIMKALLKMADDDGFVMADAAKKPITLIKKGDKVRIEEGPFSTFPALVEGLSKDRKIATVWIQIFGGKTLAEMHIEHLKPIHTNQMRKAVA